MQNRSAWLNGWDEKRDQIGIWRLYMLKRILVCAALLTPLAAFAADHAPVDQPDGSEKDICNDIGPDPARCARAPQCFWDTTDQRCEWIGDPGICANYVAPNVCVTDPHCFWDAGDLRCELRPRF
jgi:hypothetical protein